MNTKVQSSLNEFISYCRAPTYQNLIPVFYLAAIVCYTLEQLQIYHHLLLGHVSLLSFLFMPVLRYLTS